MRRRFHCFLTSSSCVVISDRCSLALHRCSVGRIVSGISQGELRRRKRRNVSAKMFNLQEVEEIKAEYLQEIHRPVIWWKHFKKSRGVNMKGCSNDETAYLTTRMLLVAVLSGGHFCHEEKPRLSNPRRQHSVAV